MLEGRTKASVCPICGSDSITQILCDTLLSAHFRGMACPAEGVVAYHCEESHVFLLLREDFRWGTPVPGYPADQGGTEKRPSSGDFTEKQLARKLSIVVPNFWLLISTILGRERRLQSLGLLQ